MSATFYLYLLAVLQIADYFTTRYALEALAGFREGNPLMARLFRAYGMRRVLIVKGIAVVAMVAYFDRNAAAWTCLPFIVVVANNIRLILAARRKQ